MPDNQVAPMSRRLMVSGLVTYESGYRWARGRVVEDRNAGLNSYERALDPDCLRRDSQERTWLVSKVPWVGFRLTRPLEWQPGLFLDFLSMKPVQREMLAFANVHGELGLQPRYPKLEGPDADLNLSGEPLWQWKRSILWMKQAHDLWEMASRGDAEAIGEVVELKDLKNPTIALVLAVYDRQIRGQRFRSSTTLPAATHMRVAARFLVQEIVNEHLSDTVSYMVQYNPNKGRFENHLRPRSLLGALWVQFSESLDPDRAYRHCRHCGKWFTVSPSTKRRDAVRCSTKCRVAAFAKRKRTARELRQQGMTIKAIAAEVGSRPQTVKGWVADVK